MKNTAVRTWNQTMPLLKINSDFSCFEENYGEKNKTQKQFCYGCWIYFCSISFIVWKEKKKKSMILSSFSSSIRNWVSDFENQGMWFLWLVLVFGGLQRETIHVMLSSTEIFSNIWVNKSMSAVKHILWAEWNRIFISGVEMIME